MFKLIVERKKLNNSTLKLPNNFKKKHPQSSHMVSTFACMQIQLEMEVLTMGMAISEFERRRKCAWRCGYAFVYAFVCTSIVVC
jgi:hypothetical protein